MMKTAIKSGFCGALFALPLFGLAETGNPDLIAGYTTQQIADGLPRNIDGLARRSLEVVSEHHTFQSEYIDPATMRKVLVTVYTLPVDSNGNIPVASTEADLNVVVASAEKEMLRQRIKPDQKVLSAEGSPTFRCLQTVMNEKVAHQLCSTLFKGRVLEIQPVFMVNDKNFAPAMQNGEALVLQLGKTLASAVK